MLCRLLTVMLVGTGASLAQTAAPEAASGHSLTFDVVSVRLNISGGDRQFGPTPNGYRMTNSSLLVPIITAFVPTAGAALYAPGSVTGVPDWVRDAHFDIEAKIGEADLADWQNPKLQPAMLQAMLQAMLKDRFKIEVHRDMKEVAIYSLLLKKGGPKFKETTPDEPHPAGRTLPGDGGVMIPDDANHMIHFYAVSMPGFAFLLSDLMKRPVQDNTHLVGKFDLAMLKPVNVSPSTSPQGAQAPDPGPTVFSALEDLGLKLEGAKGSVETLVIDHLERLSEN
ncbi:MAG TPA: TIGR03435 family protein [Acidobacteriaceae bacterium]